MPRLGDPAQFQPPQTNVPFSRSFPTYETCRPSLALNDILQGEVGSRRLNVQAFRCALLVQREAITGFRRLLDVPNWIDCRVENPPDKSALIEKAMRVYSNGASPEGTYAQLQDINDALEEAKERGVGGADASLGFLDSLTAQLARFPRQGTTARAALEGQKSILFTVSDAIFAIIKDQSSFSSVTLDQIRIILYSLVDLLFFVGDYVSEYDAFLTEYATRFFSEERALGIPKDKLPGVASTYAAIYGARPSMQTIRSWCKAGEARRDYYLFPDGSTQAFLDAQRKWQATKDVVDSKETKAVVSTFGANAREFYGISFLIGAWLKTYTRTEIVDYLIPDLRAAVARGNSNSVVTTIGFAPFSEEQRAEMRVEGQACKNVFGLQYAFWVPFWENTVLGNFNRGVREDVSAAYRTQLRKGMGDIIFGQWTTRSVKDCTVGGQYNDYTGTRIDAFARKFLTVWDMLQAWAKAVNPFDGKRKRLRTIEKILTVNPDQSDRLSTLYFLAFNAPQGNVGDAVVRLLTLADGVGAPPQRESFSGGVRARCPGGPQDSSCLPCDLIKQRRPIGAKPIEIPTYVEWGTPPPLTNTAAVMAYARARVEDSLEFAAWAKRLREAGYPDYYIDCIARDVIWKKRGTSITVTVQPQMATLQR